jgi:hypothetical protein
MGWQGPDFMEKEVKTPAKKMYYQRHAGSECLERILIQRNGQL